MDLEGIRARARERLAKLAAQPNDSLDAFQGDVLSFFSRVPEPPLYRRRDDPTRAVAAKLAEEGEVLLARAWRIGSPVEPFADALEAHLIAVTLMAAGRVETAEPAWHEALAKERAATAPLRLWSLTGTSPPPIYESGRSRFDPRPEAQVEAKLACPACKQVSQFSLSPRVSLHRLECPRCAVPFAAYVAEVREVDVVSLGRNRRRYEFRVEELSGLATRVEFFDSADSELGASRRDLLAFLYYPESYLRGVLNLNTSRVLWVSTPGPCFVATVAFGEGAPELDTLRAFRDEVLQRHGAGRAFIRWYYREGPALAEVVKARPILRSAVRSGLRVVERALKKRL